MARPALRIDVSTKDQRELQGLLSGGVQQVRVVLRALALLQLAKGASAPRISTLGIVISKAAWNGRSTRGNGPERRRCWTTTKNNG